MVDYAIASPWLLPNVTRFEFLEFNECYPDVHNPLSLQIRCDNDVVMSHNIDNKEARE